MDISCGIFIVDKHDKVLICHATGHPMKKAWGIPKGHMEENEKPEEAAFRETEEETNIDLSKITGHLQYLGERDYTHFKKRIKVYLYKCTEDLSNKPLFCKTTYKSKRTGYIRPEIDSYLWVSIEEALKKVHYLQSEILTEWLNKNK